MKLHKWNAEQIQIGLQNLDGWVVNSKNEIQKTFEFENFKEAMLFVGAIAWEAESENHHPDILIQWNKVTLALVTHDAGGLTEKDFALAARADALS